MARVDKHSETPDVPSEEPPANPEGNFLTPEEVFSLMYSTPPGEMDRDVNSYTQEEVDAMVADLTDAEIQELAELVVAAREAYEVEANPASDRLTPG